MSASANVGKGRAGTIVLLALVAACACYWWLRLRPQPALDLLLRALPENQAVVAYIDVPALRRSSKLGPWLDAKLAEQDDRLPLAVGVRGVAVALGEETVYLAAALDLSEAEAVGYLAQSRAGCSEPLDEAVCSRPSQGGDHISLRLLEGNVLAIAHSKDPRAAERFAVSRVARAEEIAAAHTGLEQGAIVWAGLDPARLDEVMRNPPEGWINLSLVTRALGPAKSASLVIRELDEDVSITLTARCTDQAVASELLAVLGGLNRMAAAVLASAEAEGDWGVVAKSFQIAAQDASVDASWLLPMSLIEGM